MREKSKRRRYTENKETEAERDGDGRKGREGIEWRDRGREEDGRSRKSGKERKIRGNGDREGD